MKINWKFISILFILFFVSVSFVSANDLENQTMNIANEENIGVDDTSNYKNFDELGKLIYGAKDGDTIVLNDSYINKNSSTIKISKSITLNGNGVTIDGNGKTRIFTVTANNVVLKNIKFVNGYNTIGGAISWSGDQGTIENCIFDKNTASTSAGGAIYWGANNGKLIKNNFTNNNAQTSGGAISIEGDKFTIEGNIFSDNTGKLGGALRAVGDSHTFTNNEFSSNTASTSGGAIRVEGDDTTIVYNNFDKNNAKGTLGGAIIALGNDISIANNIFTNNAAKIDGGAIDIEGAVSDSGSIPGKNNKIESNNFINNSGEKGGAISFNGELSTISNNNFTKNHATQLGGAIRWAGVSATTGNIINNKFEENSADVSGGAIFSEGNKSTITENTFKNNKLNEKTGGAGGAMNIHGNDCIIENNKYLSNTATLVGGAINYEGNNGKINKNIFNSNKATTSSGGALYASGDSITIEENDFTKNTAAGNLGGAISINGKDSAVNNNNFTQNAAKTNGGGAYIKGTGSTITNNEFDSNTADNTGGALRVENGDNTKIDGNEFNKNTAKSNGGAINIEGAKLTITNNKFIENEAQNEKLGGAIWFKGDNVNINSNTFKGNTARTGTAINGETTGTKINKNTFLNSVKSDVKLVRLDGSNNDVSNNIYKEEDTSTKLTMHDVIIYYGGSTKLIVTLTDSSSNALANKKVTINFNNNNQEMTTDSKGQVSLDIKGLNIGTYKATAKFAGDSDYDASTATATITAKSTIESKDLTAEYGSAKFNATFFDSTGKALAKGETVSFTVDNDAQRVQVGDNGVATITVNKAPGDYTVNIINTKTGESATNKLKITKASANLKVTAKDIAEGENAVFDITSSVQNAQITLTINGTNYPATLEKGKAKITVSNLTAGKYPYTVKYVGNENYTAQSVTGTLNVKSDTLVITAPDLTKFFGGSERFVVNVADKTGASVSGITITILINGVQNNRTVENGQASVGINLQPGNYTVLTTFKGNDDYNAVNATSTVTVKTTNHGKDVSKIEKGPEQYVASFTDGTGKKLTNGTAIFNINGVLYYREIESSSGQAKLNLKLGVGEYTITAYNPVTYEQSSNIVKINPRFANNSDVTKYYRNATQYHITLLGDDGKAVGAGETVTFNINGVFYERETDENGTASLNINLITGDYVITAIYKECMISNKIKVLPIIKAQDIVMNYRDGTQFKATLLDGQGNPYPSQNMTFNINGVFYPRVTDNNGMAALNINLMRGEYIITSYYETFATSNKITIK